MSAGLHRSLVNSLDSARGNGQNSLAVQSHHDSSHRFNSVFDVEIHLSRKDQSSIRRGEEVEKVDLVGDDGTFGSLC